MQRIFILSQLIRGYYKLYSSNCQPRRIKVHTFFCIHLFRTLPKSKLTLVSIHIRIHSKFMFDVSFHFISRERRQGTHCLTIKGFSFSFNFRIIGIFMLELNYKLNHFAETWKIIRFFINLLFWYKINSWRLEFPNSCLKCIFVNFIYALFIKISNKSLNILLNLKHCPVMCFLKIRPNENIQIWIKLML